MVNHAQRPTKRGKFSPYLTFGSFATIKVELSAICGSAERKMKNGCGLRH
jgi:hypothetical protein